MHFPTTSSPLGGARPGWAGELRKRMQFRLLLKVAGVTAFMWLFFNAYFYLLHHPAGPVIVMPLTALDRLIPFQPGAFAAYVSLWVYVGIPPGLMLNVRQALVYGLWIGALCLTGLALFYFWPSAVPPPQVPPDLARHPAFTVLRGVDAAGNACPSLHVAAATFTAFWVRRLLHEIGAPRWLGALNWVWLALIVHSTLAIKQHVVIDVLAGALLAAVFVWPSLRWSYRAGAARTRR